MSGGTTPSLSLRVIYVTKHKLVKVSVKDTVSFCTGGKVKLRGHCPLPLPKSAYEYHQLSMCVASLA